MERSTLSSYTMYDIALTSRTLRACASLADRVCSWAAESSLKSFDKLSDALNRVDGDEQSFVNACHLAHIVTVLGVQLDALRNGVMAPIVNAALASLDTADDAVRDIDEVVTAGRQFVGRLDDIDVETLWALVSKKCCSVAKTLRAASRELESSSR